MLLFSHGKLSEDWPGSFCHHSDGAKPLPDYFCRATGSMERQSMAAAQETAPCSPSTPMAQAYYRAPTLRLTTAFFSAEVSRNTD
jgi:hypothetical protein